MILVPPTSALAVTPDQTLELSPAAQATAEAVRDGLTSSPKTLPPWLFYDEAGSELFEQITRLPEYYLTRTERELFVRHAGDIFAAVDGEVTIVELGAGTATKTGVLLEALAQRQREVLYQPVDISASALDEACTLESDIPRLTVQPQVANYITESFAIERGEDTRVLALYIGSSIGNFSPEEARGILRNLRANLEPGDALLLGTDLAPSEDGRGRTKTVSALLAAYNDTAGVTAAFNRNMLFRLNRELRANFRPDRFRHCALWNAAESRIEMHLQSTCSQTVHLPENSCGDALTVHLAPGETIHTENSYKFTRSGIASLLRDCGFSVTRTFADPDDLFAVTLAAAQ
ncbi:MAG: L-histidine N(alpha)-methyltransferase [Acidobacteriaceae bacterium]